MKSVISIGSTILAMWLLNCANVLGGVLSLDGNETCNWANKSLIVARVLDTERDRHATKYRGLQYYVTLDPKMTLAGSFDCAGAGKMRIPIVIGAFGSPLDAPPPIGSLIVVHLELANEGYLVPGFQARYMPESLPVWEVWGLHDEALLKIVTTVGERRREGAKKEQELQKDCARWLRRNYPQHAEFIRPPVDASFETRSVVLVRVKSIDQADKNGLRHVSLRLIGAAAGRVDPALLGEVQVAIPRELAVGRKLPGNDDEMFVALQERDGKYVLPEGELDYMPSGWAFSHLETSVDATCDNILAKLRKRAQGNGAKNDNPVREGTRVKVEE
jgi:hypothetical protein